MNGFTRTFTFRGIAFPAKVVDAKKPVELRSTSADLIGAKRADSEYCRGANTIMRHANSGVFPHPVIAAKVIKSMVYILRSKARTLKNGGGSTMPIIVRYIHSGLEIRKFDRDQPITADRTILLRAIPPTKKLGADNDRKRNTNHGNHRPSSERVAKPRVCGGRGPKGREMDLAEYEQNKKASKLYTGKG